MDAKDHGVVLRHGDGPGDCDYLGARDVWVYNDGAKYYMHYDGAGREGWLACLAVSEDGVTWEKRGPILDFGAPEDEDSRAACYGTTYRDGDTWHMYYLGTPNVSPAPDYVPSFPYLTMKARSTDPAGPWTKQPEITPFRPKPGTYYSETASPGPIVRSLDTFLQFIVRTNDLNSPWTFDPAPMVPVEEQIENASLYFEASIDTWYLFTNHIGIREGVEYTDAIWVYWTRDLDAWDPANKAIVLDGSNCDWSEACIGLPSVLPINGRLALYYDAPGKDNISHMRRDIGLAWLDLPLAVP
jgi:hypothetical protein